MNERSPDYIEGYATSYCFKAPENIEKYKELVFYLSLFKAQDNSVGGLCHMRILELKTKSKREFQIILSGEQDSILSIIKKYGAKLKEKEEIKVLLAEYLNYNYHQDGFDRLFINTGYQEALHKEIKEKERIIEKIDTLLD